MSTAPELNEKALEAAMLEAGSGWGMHIDAEKKRWLMGEAIRAYLSAVPSVREAVAVKALEWVRRPIIGGEDRVMSYDGYYWLSRVPDGFIVIGEDGRGHVQRLGGDVLIVHPTEEDAKAAAQADYETRIRSALSATEGVPQGEAVAKLTVFEAFGGRRKISVDASMTEALPIGEYNLFLAPALRQGAAPGGLDPATIEACAKIVEAQPTISKLGGNWRQTVAGDIRALAAAPEKETR